jgi:Uma2 family endonuclease
MPAEYLAFERASQERHEYADGEICGPPIFEDETRDVVENPTLIVEVLSESTERYDRGDKFTRYRTLGTLEDYILVSQTTVLVEHYHRLSDGTWLYRGTGSAPGSAVEG